jgi:hypothetical protein
LAIPHFCGATKKKGNAMICVEVAADTTTAQLALTLCVMKDVNALTCVEGAAAHFLSRIR